jgi:hypothetical protein
LQYGFGRPTPLKWIKGETADRMQSDQVEAEPGSEKRKGLTLRLNHAAWRQLRQLALDEERSAHELLIDALNDYFEKSGKPRSA